MNQYYNNNLQTNYQIGYGVHTNTNCNYNLYPNPIQNQTKKIFNYTFENLICNEISQCVYPVLSKTEIANRYGLDTNGISNMILGPNFIVLIQTKWSETKPSRNDIINFIWAAKRIGQLENKCYLGIYLSKLPIPSDAQFTLERDNISLTNRFVSVCSKTQFQILYELKKILYGYGIFFYESDGCVVMLD